MAPICMAKLDMLLERRNMIMHGPWVLHLRSCKVLGSICGLDAELNCCLLARLENGLLVPVTGRISAGPCGRH